MFRERTEHFLDVVGRMLRLHLGVRICPSGRSAYDTKFLGNAVKLAEHKIAAELRRQQRHVVMDWTEFEKSVTAISCFNPSGDRLGQVPFSLEGVDAVVNFVVSKLDRISPTVLAPAHGRNGTADLAMEFCAHLPTERVCVLSAALP